MNLRAAVVALITIAACGPRATPADLVQFLRTL